MTNSFKHTPITGITKAKSEKKDKQIANRRLRKLVNQSLKKNLESTYLSVKDISDKWTFDKDGKTYIKDAMDRLIYMRK